MAPISPRVLYIDTERQELTLREGQATRRSWPVSTSAKGLGCRNGSFQTPYGWHRIRACIGAGQAKNAVFIGRRPTGEIYNQCLADAHPNRDWILTRILWLCGEEVGINRGGDLDSQRRYIYIHGTPDSEPMGTPNSHGCIRMRNDDILALFEWVRPGDKVLIS